MVLLVNTHPIKVTLIIYLVPMVQWYQRYDW